MVDHLSEPSQLLVNSVGEEQEQEERDLDDEVQSDQGRQNEDEAESESDSDSENEGEQGEQGPAEEVEPDELEALKKEAQEAGEAEGTLDHGNEISSSRKRKRRGEQAETQEKRPAPAPASKSPLDSNAIWDSFKADAHNPNTSSISTSRSSASNPSQDTVLNGQAKSVGRNGDVDSSREKTPSFVKVIQTFRTEKILPTSHPDAAAFIKKQKKLGQTVKYLSSPDEPASAATSPNPFKAPNLESSSSSGLTSFADQEPASSSSTHSSNDLASGCDSGPPLPKPGPRRKKGSSLAALSAALNAGKAPKMNTLEKSKLDWEGWKAGSSTTGDTGLTPAEREEMEAQTKGGGKGLGDVKGYMERRNFLERVGGRLEDKAEESKGRNR